jgi:F-type H+-transporting ATPase subunit delta
MSVGVIGKRYAKALLQLASDQNAVERVGADLTDFAAAYDQSRELRSVFENPGVSQDNRRKILRDIAAQSNMHDSVRDLLLLLSDRQRLREVGSVASAYAALSEARSGKVVAQVTTASQLPAGYFAELEQVLSGITGKRVVLVHQIDPSLIGGVVTQIGDQVFDGSVKSRLSELKTELLR